jgi:hypothetical protein
LPELNYTALANEALVSDIAQYLCWGVNSNDLGGFGGEAAAAIWTMQAWNDRIRAVSRDREAIREDENEQGI